MKKLKVKPFGLIQTTRGAVQLEQFDTYDGVAYNVSLLLFVNTDHPIVLETLLSDSDMHIAATMGIDYLSKLSGDIIDVIPVFVYVDDSDEVELITELNSADYYSECEMCTDCGE